MTNVERAGTIAIVTDATADVPPVERESVVGVPWVVVPERWRTEADRELLDEGGAVPELAALVLAPGQPPEPVEPTRDDFVRTYERMREIDRVFSIHSGASASVAVEHAREAAGAFPNVRVVEADVTGIGLGLLAARARDLASGSTRCSPDEVEAWLREHRDRVRMLVVPDRFDPTATQRGLSTRLLTRRSARDGGAPGALDRSRRLRSRQATVAAIERYFVEHTTEDGDLHLALGHGGAAGAIDPFMDLLERLRPQAEVALVGRVGPRLMQRVGTRCVAAAWLQEAAAVGSPDERRSAAVPSG